MPMSKQYRRNKNQGTAVAHPLKIVFKGHCKFFYPVRSTRKCIFLIPVQPQLCKIVFCCIKHILSTQRKYFIMMEYPVLMRTYICHLLTMCQQSSKYVTRVDWKLSFLALNLHINFQFLSKLQNGTTKNIPDFLHFPLVTRLILRNLLQYKMPFIRCS